MPLCLRISILLALTQVHCGVISDKIKISTKAKISQKARFFKMSFFLFLSFILQGATGFHGQLICKGPRLINIFLGCTSIVEKFEYANNLTDHPVFQIAFQHQCTARVTCMELACPKYVRIRVHTSMESSLYPVRTIVIKYSYYRNVL